ncbi:MAG: UDP-glucose 6-dehydrogenase [Novosphingobium sp. 28-62-57]|uniref:UDP-glucose dehydrogenase family protein n=1 Tax=unclassified Novosphingobium TaxID=2644732 RepID=UPI000BC5EF11|nr:MULTISPECIES: UDP-glucose/GDP-mannose dehydrogenase family protein [unclassified Novosphingobium]OYW50448.1 MAG: UDP-glucose 6-dehydrogenase [Novosphingobium sp. 12-62-10]OYZ11449.1 MAG: UDP-glucose 6-dehydrogenase [Novosphingobium sp. 28-62-57]OZA30903.1 MAG: UDP-glucose 6-dehydrogenase [Novosphingobium sp. 17-62-9]HQS70963.1 UDP-glucose/GDP-mannose dehydrogenase family protein [Novosphingobium sp.]
MKIAMVGSGYVGLVSGACFADFGHDVVCIDKDESKIARLLDGVMPIYEPGLAELVSANVKAGRLSFSTDLGSAIEGAQAVFIAVGTPSRRGDGHADLSYVRAVAQELAANIRTPTVVVTKSTVPVGTGDEVERIIRESGTAVQFAVVSNPEFLREGAAIGDFKRPDRIVIGAEDEWARGVMREVYRPLFLNRAPILFTSRRSSELIKYAANAFLATKIMFINEMADLCEKVGGDVQDVARGIGLDGRIGSKFLHAGPGYGGSCFPKDTLALLKTAEDYGSPVRLVEAVVKANDSRKRAMGRKVIEALGGDARGKRVGLLGLTFKPNTDDMRDAPSIAIVQTLLDAGAQIVAYDPEGMEAAAAIMPEVQMVNSTYAAVEGADAVALVTEWDAFRALDFARVKSLMKAPVLVDLRNVYDPAEARAAGFAYSSVGRV